MKGYLKYSFGTTKKALMNICIYSACIAGFITVNIVSEEIGSGGIIANAILFVTFVVNAGGDYYSYKQHLKREADKND